MERTETKPLASRLLAVALAVGVALMCAFSLTACGQSDEDQCKKAVSTELDIMKNFNWDNVKSLMKDNGVDLASSLENAGMEESQMKDFTAAWLDGFDYTITDVAVDKDKGTAKVSVDVKCKSLMAAMQKVQDNLYDEMAKGGMPMNAGESYSDYSKRMSGYVFDKVNEELDTADLTTVSTTLSLKKSDDKGWYVPTSGNSTFWMDVYGYDDASAAK